MKPKKSIGITALLSLIIAGLVGVSAGLVLLLSAQAALLNTFELLRERGGARITALESQIRAHIMPAMEITKYAQEQFAGGQVRADDDEQLLAFFRGAMAAAPQIIGVGFWDADNFSTSMRRSPFGGIDIVHEAASDNPEFLAFVDAARATGGPTWGAPNEGDEYDTYIYATTPLQFRDRPVGLLATGVTTGNLSRVAGRVGAARGMTAFVLYGDKVLVHPSLVDAPPVYTESGIARLRTLDEVDDPILTGFHASKSRTVTQADGTEFQVREVDGGSLGGDLDVDHWVLSRVNYEFGDTPWHIGIYAPADALDTQLMRLFGSIVAGVALLVIALGCALWIARKMAKPVRNLAAAAEHIGQLQLDAAGGIARSGIRELDEQAAAFNRMVDGLRWFERYVPKSLVRRLMRDELQDGDDITASREAELTVLFTDIIGFTSLSQTMSPGDVGALLNRHFEIIAQCIEGEGGTLDKYIGDAVMAFWGAPDEQPDHAARACRAALAIARALQREHAGEAAAPRIKMALHSGPLLVGNIGAASRMNYTVIGDTVNTCSRIESLCAKFDDGAAAIILVSDATRRLAEGDAGLCFEAVGGYEVKGRSGEVHVSRLLTPP